jgi:hypothetical protein
MPAPKSCPIPPRYVEYARAAPLASSFVTKASFSPLKVVSKAPTVVGKSAESVLPVT